jgi:hypothetical protein
VVRAECGAAALERLLEQWHGLVGATGRGSCDRVGVPRGQILDAFLEVCGGAATLA